MFYPYKSKISGLKLPFTQPSTNVMTSTHNSKISNRVWGSGQGPIQWPSLSSCDKNLRRRLVTWGKHKIYVAFDLQEETTASCTLFNQRQFLKAQQCSFHKFVTASHRGSGEEEGQGDENRARFMTSEDTQKHAKLPLMRKWRGWYKKHQRQKHRSRWQGYCVGNTKQRMCVNAGDLICSAVDTL